MSKLDFQSLNQTLLSQSRSLLPEWLPGGRVVGSEYMCGDIHGGPGGSMRVNVNTGRWADFAADISGGDLISLFAAINNIGNGDAYKRLNDMYRGYQPASKPNQNRADSEPTFIPPPKGTSLPKFKSKPTALYKYKDKTGQVLFLIARHDYGNNKTFTPYSWDGSNWHRKAWPKPRPLYNLDRIHKYPKRPILICEGEKAADAAHAFCGVTYNVTTWPNGSNAWNKADWSSLYGKSNILIWPDADDPGRKAAKKIADLLAAHCETIKIIDTTGFNGGKDAADFGFQAMADFVNWAKPLANKYEPVKRVEVMPDESPMPSEPPPTVVNNIALMGGEMDDVPSKPKRSEIVMWEKMGLKCNSNTGIPHNNASNVKKILSKDKFLRKQIWYDEFHHKIFSDINWFGKSTVPVREWTDADDVELMTYIQDDIGLHRCSKTMVTDAVLAVAKRNTKNEPKDWLKSISWDGTDRISNFFHDYFDVADNEYTRAISKNFWLSMVARVMKPGCKADNMIILEGKQGKFKSTALSIIGGKWYVETNENPNSKDFFQMFQGKILIEIGELDSFNKAETTKIKAVVSTATDRFRPPYGRTPQDYPRQCIFVGTTNESNYLRDSTGGRRFWPISIGAIDTDALTSDREQLFAQAVELFNEGHTWHEVPDMAMDEQEKRRQRDAWEDVVAEYVEAKNDGFITTIDVATHLGMEIDKITPLVTNRIARILRAIGCTPGKKRTGPSMRVRSGWYAPDSGSYQAHSKSQDNSNQPHLFNHAPGADNSPF